MKIEDKYPTGPVATCLELLNPIPRTIHTFTACVRATYKRSVISKNGQYWDGKGTRPSQYPIGENGNHIPTSMIAPEVMISCQLARLCRNGILLVRMTWMIRVWVSSDSTNQPV